MKTYNEFLKELVGFADTKKVEGLGFLIFAVDEINSQYKVTVDLKDKETTITILENYLDYLKDQEKPLSFH